MSSAWTVVEFWCLCSSLLRAVTHRITRLLKIQRCPMAVLFRRPDCHVFALTVMVTTVMLKSMPAPYMLVCCAG